MKKGRTRIVYGLVGSIFAALMVFGQTPDNLATPSIDPITISVHTVQFGTMPFHTRGRGVIARIGPNARATAPILGDFARNLNIGNSVAVKIAGVGGALSGKVTRIGEAVTGGVVPVEISFDQPLPTEVQAGDSADSVIEYGRIENTLYMQRGFFDQANADVAVFVLDPARKYATRVKVHFGVIASELIQITSGLQEGDKVIVTDMGPYRTFDRVLIK